MSNFANFYEVFLQKIVAFLESQLILFKNIPGGPANKTARPAIFFCLIKSTTIPAASRASFCPMKPYA